MKTSPYLIALLISTLFMVPALVAAQTSETQPFFGFSWYTKKIPFYLQHVVATPSADQAVLDAMHIWIQSQKWFISTYESGQEAMYEFVQVDQATATNSGIVITFNQTQTDNWGYTHFWYWCDDTEFYRIRVTVTIILTFSDGSPLSLTDFQAIALHELGHALGLDHTTFSPYDLMNREAPGYGIVSPSTLNLYALYFLSRTRNYRQLVNPVTLPNDVPYAASPVPVSEFTTSSTIVMLMVSLSLLVTRRRRSLG